MWRHRFRKNAKINARGRPKDSKDKDSRPKWERRPEWRDNTIDILSAANYQYETKGQVTLQFVANMTGRSKSRVSRIIARMNWRFYLSRYTLYLTKEQKMARMRMAQHLNQKIFEDPNYLSNIWFSDESYFSVGLRKNGRVGTYLPPCTCNRTNGSPCTCENSQRPGIPVVKKPTKVNKLKFFLRSNQHVNNKALQIFFRLWYGWQCQLIINQYSSFVPKNSIQIAIFDLCDVSRTNSKSVILG